MDVYSACTAKMIKATQTGAVLVVSLVILLLLTIFTASVLNTSTLEEKMAASTRDKDLAFQAAEAALKVAERRIAESIQGNNDFTENCLNGLCAEMSSSAAKTRWDDPDYCAPGKSIWACDKSWELAGNDTVDGETFSKQPRYFIEVITQMDNGDQLNLGNVGDIMAGTETTIYRITAIGYGGSSDAQVVLQSTYSKPL